MAAPKPSSPNFSFDFTGPMKPADPMKPSQPAQIPMQPQVDGNAMATLFATMGANQLQQQREYLADRRIKGVRRDMSGNVIDEATGMAPASGNPFKNDTFQTRDQRIIKEADAFGVGLNKTYTGRSRGYLDAQGVTDQMRKQGQAFGGVTTEGPDQDPAPFKGQMMPLKNAKGQVIGEQYMINPSLADDKKYKQENFAEARFGIPTSGPRNPNVPSISDESGPQVYPPSLQIQGYPEGPQQYDQNGNPVSLAPGYKPYGDAFSPKIMKDMQAGILPRVASDAPVPVKPKQPKKKK